MTARGNRRRPGSQAPVRGTLALLAVACLAGGCDVGGPPDPPPPTARSDIAFHPDAASVTVPCGRHLDFAVHEGDEELRSLVWSTAGGQTGRGPRFRYFATSWLPDTLRVDVTAADGGTRTRRWTIDTVTGFDETGFRPVDAELTLFWTMEQSFAVDAACDPLAVAWQRDGAAAGDGTAYTFVADTPGPHAVRVRVDLPDTVLVRDWTVHVQEPDDDFRYEPPDAEVTILESTHQGFAVISDAPLPDVVWTVDGEVRGTGTRFGFPGHAPGTYGIAVAVTLPSTVVRHGWRITVVPLAEGAPPPVTGLTVTAEEDFGSFRIAWPASEPGAFGLEYYELRFSTSGPLDERTWPQGTPVGTGVWRAGEELYEVVVWYHDVRWESGDEIWFAVRARDGRGLLSDIVESPHVVVDVSWWVSGRVVGPDGAPAADVRLRDAATGRETRTGADGRYVAGPFLPVDAVELEVSGTDPASGDPWSPVSGDRMTWDGDRVQDFLLIPDPGTDPGCTMFHASFTRYLRLMTRTSQVLTVRPDYRLYKWDRYPVDIHVPEWTSPRTGIDHAAAVRFAVAVWNDSMGEEYLRLVDAPPAAGIVVSFGVELELAVARSRMLQPGDGALYLAAAAPELVEVEFTDIFETGTRLSETAIHELGHCLGLYAHAYCPETPYVMNVSSSGALDDGPAGAIHPDERAAVRMIRILPQGLDMGPYSME